MSQMFDALECRQNQRMPSVQQIKANPAEFLKKAGYNIPAGVDINNPQAIINSLIQTGQIGNGRLQQIMRMFRR